MANENLSDEEYLDSLFNKISKDDGKNEMSEAEMNAAADQELQKMLQEGMKEKEQDFFHDISIDQLIARESPELYDTENTFDAGDMSLDGLNGSDEDLLGSLDSIVQEIKGDSALEDSEEQENQKKTGKTKRAKKEKMPKKEKKSGRKETAFAKKLKDLFFKVEIVDLEEEQQAEEQKKLQKEEQKKAKALEKEEAKAKKLEDKKAAAEKKHEAVQLKKLEKNKKREEKKARKAKEEAALGQEERVKLKPAFIAFMTTIIAVMTIAVVLLSESYSYQNAFEMAKRDFTGGKYEEAYKKLAGAKIKKADQMFYDQVYQMARLDKQYDSYVNYRNLQMPKEALNALIQGLSIYYEAKEDSALYNLEAEMNEQKDTFLYSLSNDFGLDEEKAREICEQEDTNEYTREIELYSSNQYSE